MEISPALDCEALIKNGKYLSLPGLSVGRRGFRRVEVDLFRTQRAAIVWLVLAAMLQLSFTRKREVEY